MYSELAKTLYTAVWFPRLCAQLVCCSFEITTKDTLDLLTVYCHILVHCNTCEELGQEGEELIQ